MVDEVLLLLPCSTELGVLTGNPNSLVSDCVCCSNDIGTEFCVSGFGTLSQPEGLWPREGVGTTSELGCPWLE